MRVKLIYSFILIIFIAIKIIAGNIHLVKYKNQADIKVYVVDYPNQADLLVYVAKYSNEAENKDEIWHYIKYPNQANVKIIFVKYKNQAGWKVSHKWQGRLR